MRTVALPLAYRGCYGDYVSGVCTHVGQRPLAPLAEQVGHVLQNRPAPLLRFGKVGLAAFVALVSVVGHTCEQNPNACRLKNEILILIIVFMDTAR